MVWFYLSSGLFLGWSLGANDAANVFGTAVATRMLRFTLAASVAAFFVILGAVISGAGPAHTYSKLGAVNALGGSFTVALAAALTVAWMTKTGLPVSTTQAIVGAIVGWDLFVGLPIDRPTLTKILATWVASPVLTALFALLGVYLARALIYRVRIHLLDLDLYTRMGLLFIAAFGAYSLGANNIANVMGVFVGSNPFRDITAFGVLHLSRTQVLFLIGGIAIAVGILTYSHRVIRTVGNEILKLSPLDAWIVVAAESLVLFIFASRSLQHLLMQLHLPTLPLVPVSSSQAVVGGVIGIGLAKGGGRALNLGVIRRIVWGWVITPVTAGLLSFFGLFFMQNVFQQQVYRPMVYTVDAETLAELRRLGIQSPVLDSLRGHTIVGARSWQHLLKEAGLSGDQILKVLEYTEVDSLVMDSLLAQEALPPDLFPPAFLRPVKALHGQLFLHHWQLERALARLSPAWQFRPATLENQEYNKALRARYQILFDTFQVDRVREFRRRFVLRYPRM